MLSLFAEPYHDDTRLYEAALITRQASGASGTSSTRCFFVAEPASKVKKAADVFERQWPMAARAESCWLAAGDVVQKCRVRSERGACRGLSA